MTMAPGGVTPSSTRVMNLSHFLTQAARRNPHDIGFVWRERQWTWREMEARVNAMAAALREEFGVTKGDRILVQSANCNQMFESMFACFRLGAVWVPANYRQSPDEVAYLAKASGARGLICGAGFPAHAAACRETAPGIDFVLSIGAAEFGDDYDAVAARFAGRTVASVAR